MEYNIKRIKYGIYGLAAVLLVVALFWLVSSVRQSEVSVDVDDRINMTPQQIESIEAIGQWEFLAIADEELVDTVRQGFLSNNHLSRIYYGTVRLGIDMRELEDGWIKASGDSLVATLPKIGLLDKHFIDEARTKSFYEKGRWTAKDREDLYQRAHQRMLRHCLTPENIRSARQNGEAQFRKLMQSMGFEHVAIRWEDSPQHAAHHQSP